MAKLPGMLWEFVANLADESSCPRQLDRVSSSGGFWNFFSQTYHFYSEMPRNVEIKAYVSCMASLRAKASELSKSNGEEIKQSDTFFNVNQGRLKLRHLIGTDAQLVYYERGDKEGPKLSDYHIVTTDKPDDMSKVLSKALGIRGGNAYFFK